MKNWKLYELSDFDGHEPPWAPLPDDTFAPCRPLTHNDLTRPEIPEFDPAETYFTKLVRDWNGNKTGARVLVSMDRVAVEMPPPETSFGIGNEISG